MYETWVDIEDYPNYAVSNKGRVLNKVREYVLSPRMARNGALRVALSHDGQIKEFYIHHLVAQAFFNHHDLTEQVWHADGDKQNNTPQNLRIRKRHRMVVPRNEPVSDPNEHEEDRHWGRRILVVETQQVFRTVRDCARYIQGDYSSIYACLRQRRQSHRGYTFKYID